MSAIQLEDFKKHLSPGAQNDTELQTFLDAAESWVAAHIGAGTLGQASTTYKVRACGWRLILPATRLATVDSITDPDGQAVDLDLADVNLLSGLVGIPYQRAGEWTVTVTRAAAIPADVRLAILIIAQHLWGTQRVSGQTEGRPAGFGGGAPAAPPAGYAIPNRARALLEPYRVPVIA